MAIVSAEVANSISQQNYPTLGEAVSSLDEQISTYISDCLPRSSDESDEDEVLEENLGVNVNWRDLAKDRQSAKKPRKT